MGNQAVGISDINKDCGVLADEFSFDAELNSQAKHCAKKLAQQFIDSTTIARNRFLFNN